MSSDAALIETSRRDPFAVVIPTYRNLSGLANVFAGLYASTRVPDKIVLIDNGGDVPRVEYCPIPLVVERPGWNTGVASAWNRGMRVARPLDCVILNDDILLGPDTLGTLVDMPPEVGLGFVRQRETGIAGGYTCFLLRRWAYDAIGPFDEGFYPAYYEDVDYTERLQRSGLPPETVSVVSATWHHASAGRGHLPWVAKGASRNRRRFIAKWGYDRDAGGKRFASAWDGGRTFPFLED